MGNWKKGWQLIIHSCRVFLAYPVFLLPLLVVWIAYAGGVLYLRYDFDWKRYGIPVDIGVMFACLFALSFLILMAFASVLEMIRQIESGKPSLARAIASVLGRDLWRVLPLALVWAILWLLLTLLEAALSNKNKSSDSDSLTAQHAAATLANFDHFSFSEAFISALQKGIRMVMFLILPAIAWQRLGFVRGVKKGLAVLRAHLGLFATGYTLTYAATMVVFLPAAIILTLGTGRHGNPPLIVFPGYVWIGVIIYMGIAWTLSIYLEQMFMAQMYLWHMAWEQAVAQATANGQPPPPFTSVPQPELLAKTPGLFAQIAPDKPT